MEEKASCQFLTGLLIKRLCLGKSIGKCSVCELSICKTHSVELNAIRYCQEHAPADQQQSTRRRRDDGTWDSDPFPSSTSSSSTSSSQPWTGGGGKFNGGGASGDWKPGPATPPVIVPVGAPVDPAVGAAAAFTEEDFADFEKMAQGEEVDPRETSFDS